MYNKEKPNENNIHYESNKENDKSNGNSIHIIESTKNRDYSIPLSPPSTHSSYDERSEIDLNESFHIEKSLEYYTGIKDETKVIHMIIK